MTTNKKVMIEMSRPSTSWGTDFSAEQRFFLSELVPEALGVPVSWDGVVSTVFVGGGRQPAPFFSTEPNEELTRSQMASLAVRFQSWVMSQ